VFSDRPHVGMLHDFALSPPWLKVASHLVDPMPAAVQVGLHSSFGYNGHLKIKVLMIK
jgi:hypothetical protein